jgi:hypothetical protein
MWVRYFIDVDTEDYKVVTSLVDRWYDDKIASTMGIEI